MTEAYTQDAVDYLLGDMDETRRVAFEARVERFPAARVALAEGADSLAALQRQALDVPFFGDVVQRELVRVVQMTRRAPRSSFARSMRRLRRLVSL